MFYIELFKIFDQFSGDIHFEHIRIRRRFQRRKFINQASCSGDRWILQSHESFLSAHRYFCKTGSFSLSASRFINMLAN